MKDERPLKINTSMLVSYAYGMLAPEIAEKVRKALEEDESLRWEYEGIVQLMKDYPDEDPEELLEQMAKRVQQQTAASFPETTNTKTAKGFFKNWLLLAAIFIIVAGCGILVAIHQRNSPQWLAAEMIQTTGTNPYDSETRGAAHNNTTAWKEHFINNDFTNVISVLQNKKDISREEQFFLAVAYLKLSPSQPQNAEPLLQQLTISNSDFTSDAWLYLGLAQSLQDKKTEAINSLSHVEQTAQVKDLLDRLRQ